MNTKEKYFIDKEEQYNSSSLEMLKTRNSVKLISVIFLIALCTFICIIIYVPWQQTVNGYGKVTAYQALERKQSVQSPIEGKIIKWFVSEGQSIKKDMPVVEVSDIDDNYVNRLNQQKQAIINIISSYNLKREAIQNRIEDIKYSQINSEQIASLLIENKMAELKAYQKEIDFLEAEYHTANLNYQRIIKMKENALSSSREFELAELKYKQANAKLEKAKNSLNAANKEYQSAIKKLEKIKNDNRASINKENSELASAISELEKARQDLAKIEVDLARQSSRIIRSSVDGNIFRITKFLESEYVKKGETLASIIPDTEQRAVELWLDGNDVPLVSPGDKVRLQFEGWPALQFSGWPSISVGTFPGIISFIDQSDSENKQFRVLITEDPEGEKWPSKRFLRQGSRSYGWVMLREVKLWFEIWRQFNGFPLQINEEESIKAKDDPVKLKRKK